MEKVAYSINEISKIFGINSNDIYEAIAQGRIKAKDYNGKPIIPAESIKEFWHGLDPFEPGKVNNVEIEKRILDNLKGGSLPVGIIIQRVGRKKHITRQQIQKEIDQLISNDIIVKHGQRLTLKNDVI